MTSKITLFAFLLTGLASTPVSGQRGMLGSSGTYCRDGWKFSATYVLEPWLPAHQHVSIEGLSDVLHTDAGNGSRYIARRKDGERQPDKDKGHEADACESAERCKAGGGNGCGCFGIHMDRFIFNIPRFLCQYPLNWGTI